MNALENKIKKYLVERKWDKLRPADIAKSITIESAELLELFQWENLSLAAVRKNKEKLNDIKKELADVLIYALDMSVLLGFDTEKIIEEKLESIAKKYPAERMRKAAGKKAGTGADSEYWKIKQAYRKRT